MSNAPSTRVSDIISRLHRAAFKQGVAFGIGLWDRIPLAVAMRIGDAGIAVEDVDFSRTGDPIVMDASGDLHLCTTHGVRPVREGDGHWGD